MKDLYIHSLANLKRGYKPLKTRIQGTWARFFFRASLVFRGYSVLIELFPARICFPCL